MPDQNIALGNPKCSRKQSPDSDVKRDVKHLRCGPVFAPLSPLFSGTLGSRKGRGLTETSRSPTALLPRQEEVRSRSWPLFHHRADNKHQDRWFNHHEGV